MKQITQFFLEGKSPTLGHIKTYSSLVPTWVNKFVAGSSPNFITQKSSSGNTKSLLLEIRHLKGKDMNQR